MTTTTTTHAASPAASPAASASHAPHAAASKPVTPTAAVADKLEKFRTRVEHTLDADALAMLSAAITELRAL